MLVDVLFCVDLREGNDRAQPQGQEGRAEDAGDNDDDDDDDGDGDDDDQDEDDGAAATGRAEADDGQDYSDRATVELLVGACVSRSMFAWF